MAEIRFENISKSYGKQEVIRNLSFSIPSGSFTVLVGPSGCGKSTILRLIAGLEHADDGRIWLDDECVNEVAPKDRDIAIVFQNYALYPHMTVFENMAFGLKIRKVDKKTIEEKVTKTALNLQISHLLNRKPAEMSGGQRQRVAIGRAIVREPRVFLFDEPLSNLDASLRNQMRWEIAELHKKLGITTVYVTHDQVEAMTLGDNIIVLDHGIVRQQGTAKELYDHPADYFVASFIGSPPMNFIKGSLQKLNGETRLKVDSVNLNWPVYVEGILEAKSDITAGIRPEHLSIYAEPGNDRLKASITHIEYLGYESFAQITMGDHHWIVRKPGTFGFTSGQTIWIEAQPGKLHFF